MTSDSQRWFDPLGLRPWPASRLPFAAALLKSLPSSLCHCVEASGSMAPLQKRVGSHAHRDVIFVSHATWEKHCKLQCILHVRALRPRKISYAYYIYIYMYDQLLLHYTAKFGKEHMQKQRKNNKKHTGGLRNHNFGKTKNTWEETKTKTKIKQQKHGKKQRTFQKFWGWGRVTTSLNSYFFPKFIFVFSNLRSRLWFFQVYWFFQIWARKASGRLFYFYIFLFFTRYF